MSDYSGFKTQLKDVLSNAVSYFQDTGEPNAACIKAANEAGFNVDQADRLVEAFNTARVLCHYKSADDKTSGCSLADKDTVRRKIASVPVETKKAEYDTVDYGCYRQAEIDYVVPEVKLAETTVRDEPLSKEAEDWLAIREAETIRELMKTASEEARLARSSADSIAEKVAMAISRNVSIEDVHDKVARLVTAYATDDRYYPGVEKVAEFIPTASDPDAALLKKYASQHIVDTDDLAPFLPAIKEASDFVAEAAALEAYCSEMNKLAADDDIDGKTHEELEDLLLRERIKGERSRNTAISQRSSPVKVVSKQPSTSLLPGGSFTTYLSDLLRSKRETEYNDRIGKATAGVNNLRRQLILQDLLIRDKILSQEDPDSVAAAFRSINQISPDSTLNKEVLRSMLRSAVQSVAISPYDAKALADADKSRRQAYAGNDNGGSNNG